MEHELDRPVLTSPYSENPLLDSYAPVMNMKNQINALTTPIAFQEVVLRADADLGRVTDGVRVGTDAPG